MSYKHNFLVLKTISPALFLSCSGSGFRILLFYCAIFDLVYGVNAVCHLIDLITS